MAHLSDTAPPRLFLVGPMGVGKTTIGKTLAEELGLAFVDADREIEHRSGVNVAWIFDVEGEEGFREREAQLLAELTKRGQVLVATGGGVVLRAENRRLLKERGIVVHLDADVELLVKRTERDTERPLLQVAEPGRELARIKQERDPLYREVASVTVRLADEGKDAAASRVLDALTEGGFIDD